MQITFVSLGVTLEGFRTDTLTRVYSRERLDGIFEIAAGLASTYLLVRHMKRYDECLIYLNIHINVCLNILNIHF